MSEIYIPEECPLCDRVGTVAIERTMRRAYSNHRSTVLYEHRGCYCIGCGASFVPSGMMAGNLHRMREAFEKMEVTKCQKN